MATTRREILKTGLIAGAGIALPMKALAGGLPSTSAQSAIEDVRQAHAPGTEFTRGPGLYPGAPKENFQPELFLNPAAPYCNLALLRPAFASSSYDYNLTAQLVTDGLKDTKLPDWISTLVNGEVLPKHEREIVVDHFESAVLELSGTHPSVELHLGDPANLPEIDRMEIFVVVPASVSPAALSFVVSVSDDGHIWRQVGSAAGGASLPTENYPPDLARGAQLLRPSIPFTQPVRARCYRAQLGFSRPAHASTESSTANAGTTEAAMAHDLVFTWRLGQLAFFRGQQRVNLGGPYSFTSAWKSAGLDQEWVSVDLGSRFSFDQVKLHWIARAAEGRLQVSDDNREWKDVSALSPLAEQQLNSTDIITLPTPAVGRYVRVLLERPGSPDGYILSELEVYGHGGFLARPKPLPAQNAGGALQLSGGSWKLLRSDSRQPAEGGTTLSTVGYKDENWLVATVPGTALTSYLNMEAIPDPNFGQNQLHISDSFFYADFWYRTEFTAPPATRGKTPWLCLEGINWKAEVYLNGSKLGDINGGFLRREFDVSQHLRAGGMNALAILIHKNDTPGSCKQKTLQSTGKNGGALGADNPTYHASIGWDWIPTIRGRDTGIWAAVHLMQRGAATLEAPLIRSVLTPDHSYADVTLECNAVNHSAKPFKGRLRGRFGTVTFEQHVTLPANSTAVLKISPSENRQLRIMQPDLWWPVGYGDPHLYEVELVLEERGETADRKLFKAGIRQVTSDQAGGNLHLFINGRRLIAKGGSWGFSESMLRFRAREYDAAVRYHRDMNFNMIRNWVGQVGDEAFYEACDQYGVLIWQDFWLANPWDGPVPENDTMFLANSRDLLSRIRRHPSIGIYCGRNEWYPPKVLDTGLRAQLAELHPDIPYIGSSADGPVSGHGPYRALTAPGYFENADTKLHSEIGAPAIPPIETVRLMMPPQALWPLSLDYGLHDFTLEGAQGGASFLELINEAYGGATNVEDWIKLGEILSYEAYRAIFEAQSVYRMGTLLWMSHPCWPSFVWQTYDYYLQPTASYFGAKLGAEPLHIQWNSLTETIEVVNYTADAVTGLSARLEILNLDGKSVAEQSAQLNSPEDSTSRPIRVEYPAAMTPVHFLRLTLLQNGSVRSRNFYLRAADQGDYRAIRTLPKARIVANTTTRREGDRWLLSTRLENISATPALYTRVQLERAVSGDRIVPALYECNYFALMPGEIRNIMTECAERDTRGESPRITVHGFNVMSPDPAAR